MHWMMIWQAVWSYLQHTVQPAVRWLVAREPAGLPRWVWALGVVLAAYVAGRLSGRLVAGLVRVALLALALVIGWQLLHVPA